MEYDLVQVKMTDIVAKADGIQPRLTINPAKIEEYADNYRDGVDMPAIKLHEVDGVLYVCDGFTRYGGAVTAELKVLNCRVRRNSTMGALVVDAIKSNALHGQPLTLKERSSAVSRLVKLYSESGEPWSQSDIAKITGSSQATVSRIMAREHPTATPVASEPSRSEVVAAGIVERNQREQEAMREQRDSREEAIKVNEVRIQAVIDETKVHTGAILQATRKITEHLEALKGLQGSQNVMGNMPMLLRAKNDLLQIRSMQPHVVCEDCEAYGCERCRQRGWLTEPEANQPR
jgi:hypothetical protein